MNYFATIVLLSFFYMAIAVPIPDDGPESDVHTSNDIPIPFFPYKRGTIDTPNEDSSQSNMNTNTQDNANTASYNPGDAFHNNKWM
ncbi:uncharacterized protein BX664DRAFT_322196 [Halteromyces radiatus]|uniref:uncharacterized protein n=1 Tax=Halteromyces radiatus TaxID=101107 RepID=UPI00221ECCCD|nr:uncharacterized protein BX664DRAFT_322196 [Halteromyces radiatus]KAI8099817.1 hypothetical protein BX664DRAFT_322196 [Halteromyces radiatus]